MDTPHRTLDASVRPALDELARQGLIRVERNAPLSQYTRFGIGGPAAMLVDASDPAVFVEVLRGADAGGMPFVVIGGGTNLIVHDLGFDGIVLRYTGSSIRLEGGRITADAGAVLQDLVDFSIDHGFAGLHTMTGIPGWVGAAVYGNAGAYGNSISSFVRGVRFHDGLALRETDNAGCGFAYRESAFKRHKSWIILSVDLELPRGDRDQLAEKARGILTIRNEKYPPTMRCAGSIFKNLLVRDLPPAVRAQVPDKVVREGKVPSAWFLDQAGVRGLRRGDIQVAAYHANLIYNDGAGTSADLVAVIAELKRRVVEKFGLLLAEEVQYVGFD